MEIRKRVPVLVFSWACILNSSQMPAPFFYCLIMMGSTGIEKVRFRFSRHHHFILV